MEDLQLVLDADQAVLDPQLAGSYLGGTPLPPTQQGDLQARLLKQPNAQAVAYIKAFAQLPAGVKPESAIGEHTIHVEHQQLHPLQLASMPPPVQPAHASPACTRSCKRSSPITC